MEKIVSQALEDARINIANKIRICMNDGFEKNKIQIRHLQREKAMYESILHRITNFESNINNQFGGTHEKNI